MQNWSCIHPCGHSSIKFLWSCDTRAQDSFSLFKSTQCFQNMLFYQFMHPFESILGFWQNFHSIHLSGAYTFVFQKPCVLNGKFISFQEHVGFLANQFYCFIVFFVLLFFYHEVFCYQNTYIFL